MAKITKINVECSYLKSLPNYENIRFTAGVEMEVGVEEPEDVYKEAWDIVGNQIEKQLTLFESDNTGKTKKGLK